MPAKLLELKHLIHLIRELDSKTNEIQAKLKAIIDGMTSPILIISGISYRIGL